MRNLLAINQSIRQTDRMTEAEALYHIIRYNPNQPCIRQTDRKTEAEALYHIIRNSYKPAWAVQDRSIFAYHIFAYHLRSETTYRICAFVSSAYTRSLSPHMGVYYSPLVVQY